MPTNRFEAFRNDRKNKHHLPRPKSPGRRNRCHSFSLFLHLTCSCSSSPYVAIAFPMSMRWISISDEIRFYECSTVTHTRGGRRTAWINCLLKLEFDIFIQTIKWCLHQILNVFFLGLFLSLTVPRRGYLLFFSSFIYLRIFFCFVILNERRKDGQTDEENK